MTRRKLPIGIQTFAKLREEGCYYVDKTPWLLRLVREGSFYFLSRPRRFGKSLLIDTLAELFEGNRALFDGLHAASHWDWSTSYPVIRISFADGVLHSAERLRQRILDNLRQNGERLGVTFPPDLDVPGQFGELIRQARARHGQRAVVLVDEYDKPILDNITDPAIAREMRDGLRDFYSVIKGQDAHIRFAMLTGVSKFSKVSLFSGLNNLRDITVSPDYSAICGYTDEDVDTVFAPELPGLDRAQIRTWYNGYNWTGKSVYNPFDLLLLFQEREFHPYWFQTGTPTFLIDVLTQRGVFTPQLQAFVAQENLLGSFDVEQMTTEALLFQTGYLTVGSVWRIPGRAEFTLKYPNLEVQASLNESLLQRLSGDPSVPGVQVSQLYRLLQARDFAGLQVLFTAFFASIPNDWYRNSPVARFEGYYASIFYSHFAALGLDIRLEDVTNRGRIDMTVLFEQQVWLFEFKVVELLPDGRALQQVKERAYADKYRARGETI